MEITCRIHSAEVQLFQLYQHLEYMIRTGSLHAPKASDVCNISQEEMVQNTYLYIYVRI